MFYCTVYSVKSRKTLTGTAERCLSYDSENSARAYQQTLLGDVTQLGATIEKRDDCYVVEGKIELPVLGSFIESRYNNRYVLCLETDETVGARDTTKYSVKDRTVDGLDYERRVRRWKEIKAQEAQKENETIDKHLADFKASIEGTDLKETLKILIKYSQYVRGPHRDRLLDIAVDKLQGNAKSSSWYDELSDINN